MIGGGLALNDTGFILVQATSPMSSLGRSVTLFLSQVLEVCSGVTNEKEKDGVYKRSGRKGQKRQELRYELSVQVCAWGTNPMVLWL